MSDIGIAGYRDGVSTIVLVPRFGRGAWDASFDDLARLVSR